jgi:acetyl-CoA carboxylase beta subunit
MNELEELKSMDSSIKERERELPEHEIECPRCHDVMSFQSEFDRTFYFCEQCCFTLSLIREQRLKGMCEQSNEKD